MNELAPLTTAGHLPALVAACGERGALRFLEFFASNIRNPNTRRAYAQAVVAFLAWCEEAGVASLAAVQPQVAGLRRFGAAAIDLAWVAAGRFDAYWERGIKPWDMAGGIVLVREAGGTVTDLSGGTGMFAKSEVLATNSALQKEFLPILAAG